MKIKTTANIFLILALLLGALFPVMLAFAKGVDTLAFLFVTYAISVPASLIFAIAMGKKRMIIRYMKRSKDLLLIAGIGLLEYVTLEFGLSYAEKFVSASIATAIYRTNPILMLIFLPILLRERITKYQAVALVLGFLGIYIALGNGSLNIFTNVSMPMIVFLVLVTLAGSLAMVLIKKYAYDMESCMFIFSLANFIFFTVAYLLVGMPKIELTPMVLFAAFYVGIIYNVFVGFMAYRAMRMLKTTFFTNVYFISPFITFIFAYFILGEAITPYYIAIAVLVSIGILIQKFDKKGGTYVAKAKKPSLIDNVIFDVTGIFANTGEVAISEAINTGERVLAVKINREQNDIVGKVMRQGDYTHVYTDDNKSIQKEMAFVRDIMDASEDEQIVLKPGKTDDSEAFFEELFNAVEPVEHSHV
jgi:drug/metabolite transporter (DMT)-like permease